LSNNLEPINVNAKQAYHNCEMTFSFYLNNNNSNFIVDTNQQYTINTTLKEVEILNEALHLYQSDGFKKQYLLFSNELDGKTKYPQFIENFDRSQALANELSTLAKDEDSLVQLSSYCLDTAPTFVDDFYLNKQIQSITIDNTTTQCNGYEELKQLLLTY
jgi:hypothetical protein